MKETNVNNQNDANAQPCPLCNGEGVQRVGDDYEYETFECPACDGTGLAGPRK